MTVDGRPLAVVAAASVAIIDAAALVALALFGGVSNGLTPRETAGGFVLVVVGVIVALWLWQWRRKHGGRQP